MARKLGLLAVLLLLAFGAYQLWQHIEFYTEETDTGPRAAALSNPFLAAQRYLEQRGRSARGGAGLEQLDALPAGGSLIIDDAARVLTRQRAAALLRWVAQGGHLIVGAGFPDEGEADPLLDIFSVQKYATDYKSKDCGCDGDGENKPPKKLSELLRAENARIRREGAGRTKAKQDPPVDPQELAALHFTGAAQPLHIHFSPYTALKQPHIGADADAGSKAPVPGYWAGNAGGTQFLQFAVGRGTLTVLSDIGIWQYRRIGEQDHALLLELLTAPGRPVQFLYGAQLPNLAALLWRHGRELVIAAALWLCAWLVYRARRFGPVLERPYQVRRSLAEHIRAAAAYVWHTEGADTLLREPRADVQRRARALLPGYAALPPEQRIAALSAHSGIDGPAIERALYADLHSDADAFRAAVLTLQTLENQL